MINRQWPPGPTLKDLTRGVTSDNIALGVTERDALQAEIKRLEAEVSELRAARIAYANEFPAAEDGHPDTGNIHANIRALKAHAERLQAEVAEWKRVAVAQAELHGEAEERAERLAEALEEIRSRSTMNLAMRSDTFELTARLGDIYQIADAALCQEDRND